MQDLSFISNMSDDNAYLFKRCVRRLLDTTFLVKDKEEKLYQFVASESNRYDMNQYLAVIGYKVVVEEQMGVAMLQPNDDDKETVGLKRLNLYHFDQRHMKLLLVLWLLFLERMGYEEAVYVTVGEIIDKCRLYDIELTPVEFKKAYATFRRFCLIDYSDDITKEDGAVRLYPSLQFCLDIGQLKQVMAEFVEQEDFEAADMADLEEAESEESDE